MTARDEWISVSKDGIITLNSENGGPGYLRGDVDREEEVVTLDSLSGSQQRDAIRLLRNHGFIVDEKSMTAHKPKG